MQSRTRFNRLAVALVAVLASGHAAAHSGDGHSDAVTQHAMALGKPGDPAKASRVVAIEMRDTMRFVPARITLRRGETIRFVVTNAGKVKHEMVLGSIGELRKHAALMRRFPEMEHADPNQVSVEPGKSGDLVWAFTKGGTFDFACLQPCHFEAGMVGRIAVK